jgi:DNA-binding NarL/FixJ family response regulator
VLVRRCLIVDDNPRFLQTAGSCLERQGFDEVSRASTSAEALESVDAVHPDVVLVDIALGEESGFDLVRRLVEAHPELRGRVVLVSTRGEEDFADLIADSPAAGFVPKTRLTAQAVDEVVRRALAEGGGNPVTA